MSIGHGLHRDPAASRVPHFKPELARIPDEETNHDQEHRGPVEHVRCPLVGEEVLWGPGQPRRVEMISERLGVTRIKPRAIAPSPRLGLSRIGTGPKEDILCSHCLGRRRTRSPGICSAQ